MGTTVTPNLGLIKPDTDESIKFSSSPSFAGWAAQNGINCDKIDALFRASQHTFTLNWTADGGNPTLGSGGFAVGKYIRLYPRMVLVFFRIATGGAGFAAGSGIYRLNVPTGVASDFTSVGDGMAIGRSIFYDSSAAVSSSVFQVTYNPPSTNLYLTPPTGGAWSATSPVALGQGDRVSGSYLYPTSDA